MTTQSAPTHKLTIDYTEFSRYFSLSQGFWASFPFGKSWNFQVGFGFKSRLPASLRAALPVGAGSEGEERYAYGRYNQRPASVDGR